MVDNTGFISTLGATPTAQIDDATDAIHSSIIMSLNAATGENRPIEGFNITQSTSSSHTSYVVTAGDVLRNGLRVDVNAATLTTDSSTGTSNSVDWYGLIVVNSSNALAWRHGTSSPTSTGKLDTSNATVAALTAGDIPIAIVKYAASSNANLTNRPMQFLGYAQATRGFSAVNSNAETMRINADGTLTKGSATITLPSTTGTLARTADDITGNAAGLSATLAVASGGTGATTLTDGGILLGSGTGAITATSVLSNGQLLIGDGTSDPTLTTLTAGNNITVTNGAGSISIAGTANDDVTKTNLTNVLATYTGSDTLTIGDAGDDTSVVIKGNLEVKGTQTAVNTVTMNAQNAIVFEGATADAYETTLSIIDPTDDHTQYLNNQSGYIAVLGAATTTAISATPAELNSLDGYTGTVTELNYLDTLHATGVTATEFDYLDGVTSNIQTQLDAKISATLTTEQVEDIVGGMLTGNTATNITVTYQDGDGTIDFVASDSSVDINGLTAESGIVAATDTLPFYDTDVGANRKVTPNQMMAAIGHGGIPSLPPSKVDPTIDSSTFSAAAIPTLAQSKVTNLATDLAAKVPATRTIAGRALSNNLVVRVNASSGKLEFNDGSNTTTIQDTAGTPADVVFDNRKTEWGELQDTASTKPANNATVGATLGSGGNLLLEDGSTKATDATILNANTTKANVGLSNVDNDSTATIRGAITLAKSVSGDTKTLSLTNGNAATVALDFEDGATKNQVFRQSSAPTALSIGDIWVDTDDNKVYSASATGTGDWELVTAAYTDAEKTKLGTVAANATANTGDVAKTGTINANEYARWSDATTLEARTAAEVRSDLGISDAEIIDWTTDQGSTNIDTGNYTNTTYSEATGLAAGLMSIAHHDKLDGIAASATATVDLTVDGAGTVHANNYTNTTYSAGTGITLSGGAFSTNLSASEIPNLAASKITSGTFATARIADDAITSAKIADDAIITALIADDAITTALIADDAITTALIADDAITDAHIGDNQVLEAHIKSTNAPTDNYLLSYDASTSGFTWVDGASAGGANQTITTGSGIDGADSGSSSNITLTLGIQELSDVQIASGDKLLVLDSDGSTHQLESIDDIATLFAGSNLTATSGVLAVDDAFLKNDANDTTTGTITAGGFTTAGSITLGGHAFNDIDITSEASDADDHLMTALAIKNRIEDYSYTTNTGTVTSVGTNTGLSGTVTGSGNLSLALGDLADMTQSWDNAADEFIVLDGGTQKRKLSSEIFGSNAFNSTTIPTNNNQLTNGASFITASSSDTLTNKTIAISQVTELSNLTAAEGEQLENIGSTEISAAQWGYLGAASGAITNTDTNYYVTGLGLSSGTLTATVSGASNPTVDLSGLYTAGTGLDLSSTTFSVDVSDFMTNGSDNRILTATGADAMNAEANLTFDGSTLAVTGHIDATTKSFVIPHPTKENMTLRHGSLEGPEYGVYHRGRLIGDSSIELPEYWLGLVDESTITVQLTANGSFQMLYVDKIENNTVYIDNATDSNIDCFYIIHGERKDIGKMEVEY